jgi:triacylglycerol esterase/lipase EstA (alpha/beta hydrolase family)
LAELIGTIRRDTGAARVVLVAHSMGGLVARAYLRRYGGAQVRRLITIGSPHHGSELARTMFGQSLSEMRPASPWLADLNRDGAYVGDVPVTSLWSWHDSMVAPQDSSRLEGADNIVLSGIAHNALLTDPAVWERVADEIERAGEAPTSESPASTGQRPSARGSMLPVSSPPP